MRAHIIDAFHLQIYLCSGKTSDGNNFTLEFPIEEFKLVWIKIALKMEQAIDEWMNAWSGKEWERNICTHAYIVGLIKFIGFKGT